MTATRSSPRLLIATIGALALLGGACSVDDTSTTTAAPVTTDAVASTAGAADTTVAAETTVPATDPVVLFEGDLLGTFSIDPGDCTGGTAAGSYFQMVMPGGTGEAGPFIANADSTCAHTNFSLLTPGSDGGLVTGGYQAAPDPAFDGTGNGLADRIVAPVTFFGVAFAAGTGPNEAAPSITATDGVLTGDLSAFTAYYGTGV